MDTTNAVSYLENLRENQLEPLIKVNKMRGDI